MDAYARLKEGMKWMWSLGDYAELAEWLQPHARSLAEGCELRAGTRVLDVAAGNGNFALEAARHGATVTASDLSPRMVELGRARSDAAGISIEWLEADAEQLPFAAGRFDVVASVFGAMFAPRPERIAAELFRVARPGGLVVMANYGSVGLFGRLAGLLSSYGPAAPVPLPSPFAWGDPGQVRGRFEGLAASIQTRQRTLRFQFGSVEQWLDFWERANPPQLAMKSIVPAEAYRELVQDAARLAQELNQTPGSGLTLESEYLEVFARKPEQAAT
jgi:ubiquinone/menaquinone biosynthesis C-methylase UbiE